MVSNVADPKRLENQAKQHSPSEQRMWELGVPEAWEGQVGADNIRMCWMYKRLLTPRYTHSPHIGEHHSPPRAGTFSPGEVNSKRL